MSAAEPIDDRSAVSAIVEDLYLAVLAGDRPRFDRHLAPDVTVWETGLELMRGVAALTAHRDARGPHRLRSLEPTELLLDVVGDTAVGRYVLSACSEDGERSAARTTDVFARFGETWLLVHHHAEELGAAGTGGGAG